MRVAINYINVINDVIILSILVLRLDLEQDYVFLQDYPPCQHNQKFGSDMFH